MGWFFCAHFEEKLMKIKKIINNNIVSTVDEKGHELIVSGKGIGFGKKIGDEIDRGSVKKIYRMTNSSMQRKLMELLEEIPYEHLRVTDDLVEMIKNELPYKLNEFLIVTLSDHISFAIERKSKGIEFTNPLMESIIEYYPEEFRLGEKCLNIIKDRLGISLRHDEAGFIAMHIVNAELNTAMSEVYDITSLIEGCIKVTEYYYNKKFDKGSLSYSRFIVHLRYFAQRVFSDSPMPLSKEAEDETFRRLIKETCKKHYQCSEHIAEFVKKKYDKEITEEELVYLTIHLKRINMSE